MSWQCPPNLWRGVHDGEEDMTPYLDYPAKISKSILELAMSHEFWGAPFLNVNFPSKAGSRVRMTQFLPDVKEYYKYPLIMDRSTMRFTYPIAFADKVSHDPHYDTGAMASGYISITPRQRDILDRDIYDTYRKETYHVA